MQLKRRDFVALAASIGAMATLGLTGCAPDGGAQQGEDLEEKREPLPVASDSPITRIRSICGNCHNNCGVIASVQDGVVIGVEGDPDHPFNRGAMCGKGQSFIDVLYSPDRLQYPMKRVGERGQDEWERIEWDEALQTIADRLNEIKEQYGPETLLYCKGAPVQNIVPNAFQELFSRYGSPNSSGAGNLCFVPRAVALRTTYGYRDEEDYNNTDLIINWGANPFASMRPGSYMCYEKKGFLSPFFDAMERGAKLYVIDPIFTETASKADEWIPIKPATDGALGLAMINTIIGEDLYDHDFVETWCAGFDEVSEFIQEYTPEWAEGITGISAAKIQELARLYATTERAVIHEGNNFALHDNCVQAVRTIGILRAITGHLEAEGCSSCYPSVIGSPYPVELGGHGGMKTTVTPEAAHVNAERYPLLSAGMPGTLEAIETGTPYQPRALFVYHGNPLITQGGSDRMREVLNKLDFIVVCDLYYTETAHQLADIVLPDTTWMERYDYRTYPISDGGIIALRRPVIEQPLHGIRTVYDMERTLADKLGLGEDYPWSTQEEFITYILSPSKCTLDELLDDPIFPIGSHEFGQHETGALRADGEKGFETATGKVMLVDGAFKANGYPPLPAYVACTGTPEGSPEVAADYPLTGINRRSVQYVHSKYRSNVYMREQHPEPEVTLNPVDATERGIVEGDRVTVSSPMGSSTFTLRVSERVMPSTAWVDGCWGNPGEAVGSEMNRLVDGSNLDEISQSPNIMSFLMEVSA